MACAAIYKEEEEEVAAESNREIIRGRYCVMRVMEWLM
jgi:hypothetical protein